jgi:glycerol-3-phosphate dehydrogenase (NAD(P)+)
MGKISVIGAGAWGTALSIAAAQAGSAVELWAKEQEVVDSIIKTRINEVFLPDPKLPEQISVTNKLSDIEFGDAILLVVPAQFLRGICQKLYDTHHIADNIPLVICSKGIENNSFNLMSEIVSEIFTNNPIAVLSGPTFAQEVADGKRSSISVACENDVTNELIISLLNSNNFRIYPTHDIIGAQIGGAMKNVIAIACGIAAGRDMGDNTKAALISMGLQEMGILSIAKGGKRSSLMELCGIGDLVLTCSSLQSRNMSLGYKLGQGESLQNILNARKSVTEGVISAVSIHKLNRHIGISLPLCDNVYNILHENADIETLFDL